jgi:hypothetical protein
MVAAIARATEIIPDRDHGLATAGTSCDPLRWWDNLENRPWNPMERLARVGQDKLLILLVIGGLPWIAI